MDQLSKDLPGTSVYLDDILVSGKDAEDHLSNMKRLLQRLQDKGLRCRLEKCKFAEPSVEYLGHLLSQQGIAKGPKVNDVLKMPARCTIAEPLYRLTKKSTKWGWDNE